MKYMTRVARMKTATPVHKSSTESTTARVRSVRRFCSSQRAMAPETSFISWKNITVTLNNAQGLWPVAPPNLVSSSEISRACWAKPEAEKGGRGLPQSITQARHGCGPRDPKVLDCGRPLPFFCRSPQNRQILITPLLRELLACRPRLWHLAGDG